MQDFIQCSAVDKTLFFLRITLSRYHLKLWDCLVNKSITDFPWKYEIEIKSIWIIDSFIFTLMLYIFCLFWKMKFCHEIFISLSCPNYICTSLNYTNYHNNKWQQTFIVILHSDWSSGFKAIFLCVTCLWCSQLFRREDQLD